MGLHENDINSQESQVWIPKKLFVIFLVHNSFIKIPIQEFSKVNMQPFLFVFCAIVNLQELVNVLCYCFWHLCNDEFIRTPDYFLLVFFIGKINSLELIIDFNFFFGFSNLVMQWHSAKKSFWHCIVGNQSPTLTPSNTTLLINYLCKKKPFNVFNENINMNFIPTYIYMTKYYWSV